MPGYVRVIRGTFDPAHLPAATSVAQTIGEHLRATYEHFERLITLRNENYFIWIAMFREQTPITDTEAMQRIQEYFAQMSAASVAFEVEESGVYEKTYETPGPLAS